MVYDVGNRVMVDVDGEVDNSDNVVVCGEDKGGNKERWRMYGGEKKIGFCYRSVIDKGVS